MRSTACILGALFLCAPCVGAVTADYGWEDGGTICGQMGNLEAHNVSAPYPVHSGSSSLMLVDLEPDGTPQAYIAWVAGLQEGDTLSVSFARFDTTPGGAPSCRLWAHYTATGGGIASYAGSALGNSDYGPGAGWDIVSHAWTFDSDGGARNGMVIECRTYSNPGDTVWIDDLQVTAPEHALIQFNECRPVVDLTVTGIEFDWARTDTFEIVAQTAMYARAALNYVHTTIEYRINESPVGTAIYHIKDMHDGACWNVQAPGCLGWCPIVLMYAETTGLWNVIGGDCTSFDYFCGCTYSGQIPFWYDWGAGDLNTCTAVIDPDDLISEWDESNNELTIPLFPNAVDEVAQPRTWSMIKAIYRE